MKRKVLLSVDARDLATIDNLAKQSQLSRSEFVVTSVLTRPRGELPLQVIKLREQVERLLASIQERSAAQEFESLSLAIVPLANAMSRRDVPDDVKDAIRRVVDAARVLW